MGQHNQRHQILYSVPVLLSFRDMTTGRTTGDVSNERIAYLVKNQHILCVPNEMTPNYKYT